MYTEGRVDQIALDLGAIHEREIVEPFPQALAQQISGKAGLEVPTYPQKAKGCRAGGFRGFSVMIWTFWISRSQADRGSGAVLQ